MHNQNEAFLHLNDALPADIDAMAAAMKELIQEIGRAPDYKAP